MRIIALDPGGTTGVAIYERTSGSNREADNDFTWETRQLSGVHHDTLWDLLENEGPWTTVIYERFMYQRRELDRGVSLVLDSVEYIGVVKLWHLRHLEEVDLVCQTPAQAKNLWTDQKLKRLELYKANAPHANDATRHLLYYLTVTRGERQWVIRTKPEVDG